MDAFYWVIDWEGMISVSSLVGLLEKHFFPKWLQVHVVLLCVWGMGWRQGGVTPFWDDCQVTVPQVPKEHK